MIDFECNQCGKRLKVKDEAAGKKGKCPQCGVLLEVPQTAAEPVAATSAAKPTAAPTELPAVSDRSLDRQMPPEPVDENAGREADSSADNLDLPIRIAMAAGGLGLLLLALSPLFKWINFGAGGVTGISGDGRIVLGVTVACAILFALAAFTHKRLVPMSLGVGAWGIVTLFWMGSLIWKVSSITGSPEIKNNPFAAIFATLSP
jgi:phage FluMu protein Com